MNPIANLVVAVICAICLGNGRSWFTTVVFGAFTAGNMFYVVRALQ